MTYVQAVNHYRIALVRAAILRTNGNRKRAARALGIRPHYLRRLIREYAIVGLPPTHDRSRAEGAATNGSAH